MAIRVNRRGVTLIELLIVIAIVGLLLQLMLPAIQASRESARKMSCANNLRNIAIGAQMYEASNGHLPTAGWGWKWIGDPNRGVGKNQPGSWAYQLLPHLEAQRVYNMGLGQVFEDDRTAGEQLAQTPCDIFYCPSRRSSSPNKTDRIANPEWYNAEVPDSIVHMDYAANIGDTYVVWEAGPTPESVKDGTAKFLVFHGAEDREAIHTFQEVTGVIIQRQPFSMSQITDGLSNTYLIGEKRLVRGAYGRTNNDDQPAWSGDDLDTMCGVQWVPSRDASFDSPTALKRQWTFGSAHTDGTFITKCDSSVAFVSYDIDPRVHRRLGTRADGPAE